MDAIIRVRDVTKLFGRGEATTRALNRVTLDVLAGDVLLLLGPSGSGKTTLLSVMGCILRPTSGSVVVNGTDVSQLREHALPAIRRTHIGFVFQAFNLFATLTCRQNVALALDIRGIDRRTANRQATTLLHQVGLGEKRDVYPSELSGGQKQRVAIARALAGSPAVLLADEPTGALDTDNAHSIMALFRQLAHDHGCAVVIVTHDTRMLGYADRIVRMEDGGVVSDVRQLRAVAASESPAMEALA
jgi:putative ABC transport system ATP-binding protein